MRGLILVLMSNMCYLTVILISWWLLDVYYSLLSGYCLLLLVTWWLLVVTAHYRSLLLVPTFSMNSSSLLHRNKIFFSAFLWLAFKMFLSLFLILIQETLVTGFSRKLLWNILQHSRKNTSHGSIFSKVTGLANLTFTRSFSEQIFCRHCWVTVSGCIW